MSGTKRSRGAATNVGVIDANAEISASSGDGGVNIVGDETETVGQP